MHEITSQSQVRCCPHCGGKQFFRSSEEKASKSGSFAMCCFKIRIAVRPVMGGSFFPAIAIVAVNSITTANNLNDGSSVRQRR
jgi:predicted  nucleic acid-binding Zn-ribbon protein